MVKKEFRLAVSVAIILIGWVSRYAGSRLVYDTAMIAASIMLGYDVAKSAFASLRYGVISINLLVFTAALGGIYLGEYWEAAAVTFLFVFGSYLEAKALGRTRNSLGALVKDVPTEANVLRGGETVKIDVSEIKVGEIVVVKPGEKIPVDGKVLKGRAAVDEAAITGESMPRLKKPGDSVYSTTLNTEGYLEIGAEKVGENTLFSKIIHLVEEAQEKKANTQRFIERFSKYYTPAIIVVSFITYILTGNLRLSITFLVIACPGALVISTPVSIVSAIGNGAKNGIIVKGGSSLEKAGGIRIVAFDKTGTLTKGKPKVYGVKGLGIDDSEVLRIAASVETYSEHPLAKAIIRRAKEDNVEAFIPEDFQVIVGQGAKALYGGEAYYAGSRRLMESSGIEIADEAREYAEVEQQKGSTAVYVAKDEVIGIIAVRDELKEDAAGTISRLRNMGIKTYMLTGDNERAAGAVAAELGLDGYFAGLLPDDKLSVINRLREEGKVAMVGDGINDAPALAAADMGIAIKGAADVTVETADMVVVSESIERVAYGIGLSRATLNNLRTNIAFSIFVVAALLLGVVRGSVFLATGMFFHEVSVLLVIFNGIRLMGYRFK